jgi:hypothetical protein
MATLRVRIRDLASGKVRIRTYAGETALLEKLRKRIITHRAAHHPPDTAIHTEIPAGIRPGGRIASFLVVDPIELREDG